VLLNRPHDFCVRAGVFSRHLLARRSSSIAMAFDCSSWRWVSSIRSF
jgi:hypothetical protein